MQAGAIAAVFLGACVAAIVCFRTYRRMLGERERGGCLAMGAFVLGWLALLTALITGGFLLSVRLAGQ